jgi:hypothetical protein
MLTGRVRPIGRVVGGSRTAFWVAGPPPTRVTRCRVATVTTVTGPGPRAEMRRLACTRTHAAPGWVITTRSRDGVARVAALARLRGCEWTASAVGRSAHADRRCSARAVEPSRCRVTDRWRVPRVTSLTESSIAPTVGLSPLSSTFREDVSTGLVVDKLSGASFDAVTIRLRPRRGCWCLEQPPRTIAHGCRSPVCRP